jgi:hypothetical protein
MTRLLLVLTAGLSVLACATPYAKVDGVLAGTSPAPLGGPPRVTLVHEGQRGAAAPQQSFVKGDSMQTAADGVALLTLRAGYEVIVEPGSEISVENPSIFVKFGKLFVKTIRRTREALRLNTTFVSAGVEGTEFVFEVSRDGVVRLTVLEGSVILSSRTAAWASATYGAGQTVVIRGAAPPGPPQPVDPGTIRTIRTRALSIEQGARYRTGEPWSRFKPLWQKPVFFIPAALVAASAVVIVATRGGSPKGTVTINIPF